MPSLPLFIQSPVSESVLQALPFMEKEGDFRFHRLGIDPDLFPLMLDVRPCVAIFSIPRPEDSRKVCSLLESFRLHRTALGYPSRDPTLRIILVAEERTVAMERWHELGVHEFIIAPILPRALAFKVQRHHHRASVSPVPEPMKETTDDVIIVRGSPLEDLSETNPYNRVSIPLHPVEETDEIRRFGSPERISSASGAKTLPSGNYAIFAPLPELRQSEGRWIDVPPSASGGKMWNWLPVSGNKGANRWSYRGEKPEYDPKQGGWNLRGKDPELVLTEPGANPLRLIGTEETKRGKEVIIHQSIDVLEVTLTPDLDTAEGIDPNDSNGNRLDGGHQLQSDRASSSVRGVTPLATQGPEERSAWRHASGETEKENAGAYGRRFDGDESYKPIGLRALVSERERSRDWKSESSPAPVPSEKNADSLALVPNSRPKDAGEKGAVDQKHFEESRNSPESRAEPSLKPGHALARKEEELEEGVGTSHRVAQTTSTHESSGSPLRTDGDESAISSSGQLNGGESENPESDPLIARLQAALLGKEPPPTEDLSGIRRDETPRPETKPPSVGSLLHPTPMDSDLRPIRTPSSSTGPEIHSKQAPEAPRTKELHARFGEATPMEKDLRLKDSASTQEEAHELRVKPGSDDANTWSMQNLEESEALGKSKRIARENTSPAQDGKSADELDIDTQAGELFRLALEEAERKKTQPMGADEKAKLLKSIYAGLKLGSTTPEQKNRRGFFGDIVEFIRGLFQ